MKRAFLLVVLTLVTACSDQQGERTFTVSEFLGDDALRADHIARCRENPGVLGHTPNCRNAEAADGKARLDRMNKALGG